MARKPDIPRKLKREILIEAGHRCAIPTCHCQTTEIAHIVPFAEVKKHESDNLIALCPNCHTRYDRGEIDRQSMLQYKANLSILNDRYSDLEKRVLTIFAEQPEASVIDLPGGFDIFLWYLLHDGIIVAGAVTPGLTENDFPSKKQYVLTAMGREFVDRWLKAEKLD